MSYDLATPIDCGVWADPQNYPVINSCRDEAWIYFRCWEKPGIVAKYVGCLHFERVWLLQQNRHLNDIKCYPNIKQASFSSCFYLVKKSALLKNTKALRKSFMSNWKDFDQSLYNHYIIQHHDFYSDIVAAKVTFSKVKNSKVKTILDLWQKI